MIITQPELNFKGMWGIILPMKRILIIAFIVLFSASCYAEGIGTLMAVGKSQDEAEAELKRETKAYKAVKNAIEKGKIKKGDTQKNIQARYGDPVIIVSDKDYAEKWVYKPGNATFFDSAKIYLIFNSEGNLAGIRIKG